MTTPGSISLNTVRVKRCREGETTLTQPSPVLTVTQRTWSVESTSEMSCEVREGEAPPNADLPPSLPPSLVSIKYGARCLPQNPLPYVVFKWDLARHHLNGETAGGSIYTNGWVWRFMHRIEQSQTLLSSSTCQTALQSRYSRFKERRTSFIVDSVFKVTEVNSRQCADVSKHRIMKTEKNEINICLCLNVL